MNIHTKLSKLLLVGAAVFLTTSVFALPKGPCEPKPDPTVCCEEPAPGPFAFSYAKDLGLSCPQDFYINGAFLLMKAREDGLEYAIKQDYTSNENLPLHGGEIQGLTSDNHSINWNYGVRVNLGFYLNHDAWDLGFAWTYFRVNNDHGRSITNGVLVPLWLIPDWGIDADTCKTSSARWTANMHAVDLKLAKPYHISRHVIFNPHFGVRFGWIAQDYMARNGGTFAPNVGGPTVTNVDMNADNDFWGLGIRAGLDSQFHVGSDFYLFGNISAAFLYSKFEVEQSVVTTNSEPSPTTTIQYQLDHEFYTVVPNAELALGIAWNKYFCNNKYLFNAKIAYEFHAWFDQNRMRRFMDEDAVASNIEIGKGDLYLSGFSFTVGFEF